jgi:hypothetical protein
MHQNKELFETKTTFYAFSNLAEYRAYGSLVKALESRPLYVFQEVLGYWENMGYKNKKYVYTVFDCDGKEVDRVTASYKKDTQQRWELIGPRVEYDAYFQVQEIYFTVVDPRGDKESYLFGAGHPGIANAMNYLKSASRYYSKAQHEFELYSEIRKLNNVRLEPAT